MNHSALAGVIHAGKTAIAQQIETDYGHMHLIFSDILKIKLVEMLEAIEVHTTVEDITANKKQYRALLQDLGDFLDVNWDPRWFHEAVKPWLDWGCPPAVVEAIRTPKQAETFASYGFQLVWIDIPERVQYQRAVALGSSAEELERQMSHHIERHGPELRRMATLRVDGTRDLSVIARQIARYAKAA
jgi:hypothetical protein